jgi:hypothetical protein
MTSSIALLLLDREALWKKKQYANNKVSWNCTVYFKWVNCMVYELYLKKNLGGLVWFGLVWFFFLRQGYAVQLSLAWNWLCSQGWT